VFRKPRHNYSTIVCHFSVYLSLSVFIDGGATTGFILCDHGRDFEIDLGENPINQSNCAYNSTSSFDLPRDALTLLLPRPRAGYPKY